MNLRELEKVLRGEPSFRLRQVKKAIFKDLIQNWDEITTLPQNLRQKLSEKCSISELKAEKILVSKDNQSAGKVLFKLKDGFKIESVLMRHVDGRITVCLSSQVGCAMDCQFCATGQQGFKRNLTSWEIIDQVLYFARSLKKDKEKITNVVFMGMGEPFLNYDNVLETIKIFNDKDGFNLGARHISISTCGITEGIKKLAREKLQVNLAISLHASNNELRDKLMPINKKYPIEKVLKAVDDYIEKTKRRVMFEYLMIDRVNDSPEQAEGLVKILKKPLYFVNLISFNPIGHSGFSPSPGWKIKKFKDILEKQGVDVTQRYRFGREIRAACGQLVGEK
ncbi:MAG: 23S rRNA (adenine(2503)-C(2))-methyltransferase RlmN [Candidatus Nealsonbacteria bacterium]|nr:23S rRNA (adenine(2503)-C(2))-methyltransferase RlmN [Candidatus Nealsonbacteria bacterium]